MKTTVSKLVAALVLLCPVAVRATVYDTLPTTPGTVLQGGYIYTVSKNTEITGTDSLPVPLTVADGAVATIYIPAGITLKVTGYAASGINHAYAGIRVPAGTTLIITGEGTLLAYGGKGYQGGNGGNGGNGYIVKDDDKGYTGGGGGSGFAATCGIGGGGAGGQCGATGGTGGNYWKDGTGSGWAYLHGGSGAGGYGASSGSCYGNTRTSYKGKYGGAGGSANTPSSANGDEGSLYVAAKENLTIDGTRTTTGTATGHDDIKVEVSFDANMEGATPGTESTTMYYGVKPGDVDIPAKDGQFFMGYYTEASGGERIYDETGKAIAVCTNLICGKLYGKWSETHITSQEQFVNFCKGVNDGSVVTSGATYYLEKDIELDSLVTFGSSTNYFAGTFDGQEHTIKLNIDTKESYASIFGFVKGGTIKNLIATGQIKTSGKFASGLVGRAEGVTIENCISSVDVISTYSGDATNGGLIAVCSKVDNTTFTITGSAYVGRFYGANTIGWGGFVGFSGVSGTITDSYVGNVFDHADDFPTAEDSKTIVRYDATKGHTFTLTNTWYSSVFNDQGWTALETASAMTPTQCLDGSFCYAINGNSANGTWRQNIGEDSYPVLDASHNKVFSDYSNTEGANVLHNRSYVEMTNDMVFNLDYTPNSNTQIYAVYESRSLDKANYPATVTGETRQAYAYLYSNGTMTVDNIPASSAHVKTYSTELGTVPIYIQSDCRLYEVTIMENGVVVHRFLPSIFNEFRASLIP